MSRNNPAPIDPTEVQPEVAHVSPKSFPLGNNLEQPTGPVLFNVVKTPGRLCIVPVGTKIDLNISLRVSSRDGFLALAALSPDSAYAFEYPDGKLSLFGFTEEGSVAVTWTPPNEDKNPFGDEEEE